MRLPNSGKNFNSYNGLMSTIGRTYVHSKVRLIVLNAYKALEKSMPKKVYQFAEAGVKLGDGFSPYKTHRNGLSVDFMVPVLNTKGEPVHLPTDTFNQYGYSLQFDARGMFDDLRIDFDAMAAHIVQLDREAKRLGLAVWRVIFDPDLQAHLYETRYKDYLKKNVRFSNRRSWVRHDEHYHVDFEVPCMSL